MSDTPAYIHKNAPLDNEIPIKEDTYTTLENNLEELLLTARPRLARLACMYGVSSESVEDVVQETCINAWKNLAHLRSPERFESWLNSICHNISISWIRTQGVAARRHSTISFSLTQEDSSIDISLFDIPDPQTLDLTEELTRQDLAILLDRAMKHLPAPSRQALEMYYIADIPQREVALQLGMTINALEVRLHRARRQLRHVLQGELRTDAESFGLILDSKTADEEWRETSIWCFICGCRRLQGIFELQAGGEAGLRLRCPACSSPENIDIIRTGHIVPFAQIRSFRPAFKQALQALSPFYAQALATGYQCCPGCKNPVPLSGIEPEDLPAPFYRRFSIELACPACGKITASIFSLYLAYPPVSQFIRQHEHCILQPEERIEYEGQAAIRISLADSTSSARLTLLLHYQTLEVLATF